MPDLNTASGEADLRTNATNIALAKKYGVSETTIRSHRKKLGVHPRSKGQKTEPKRQNVSTATTEKLEEDFDGNLTGGIQSVHIISHDDVEAFLREHHYNPDDYDISIGYSEFTTADGGHAIWNKLQARPKNTGQNDQERLEIDAMFERVTAELTKHLPRTYRIRNRDFGEAHIFAPSDRQLGKADLAGGTDTTIQAFARSVEWECEWQADHNTKWLAYLDPGDALENFCNVNSQRETNDLTLAQQVELVFKQDFQAIKQYLNNGVEHITVSTVPSNHGQHRSSLGNKNGASVPADDYGILVNRQLELVFADDLRVEFIRPATDFDVVSEIPTPGGKIAMVHGHQASGPDKVGEWWKGQDHGRRPGWDADLLLAGHWHSLRVVQSGDARWVIICPTLEPSSSWYANYAGESSRRGALHFDFSAGQWHNLEIA